MSFSAVTKTKDSFLEKLGETAEKFLLIVYVYVLMDNHYLLTTGNATRQPLQSHA